MTSKKRTLSELKETDVTAKKSTDSGEKKRRKNRKRD